MRKRIFAGVLCAVLTVGLFAPPKASADMTIGEMCLAWHLSEHDGEYMWEILVQFMPVMATAIYFNSQNTWLEYIQMFPENNLPELYVLWLPSQVASYMNVICEPVPE